MIIFYNKQTSKDKKNNTKCKQLKEHSLAFCTC